MVYNWLHTIANDNAYILIFIIAMLGLIILNFNLLKRKSDKFYDVPNNTTPQITTRPTVYQAPTLNNPMNPNFHISQEELNRRTAWAALDGNDESLFNTTGFGSGLITMPNYQNDITQFGSTLFNTSNSSVNPVNYATVGDYATLDSLGNSLTDTIGGVRSNFGYTILDEQLGTFKIKANGYSSSNTYDNTANYRTGMNSNTVDGSGSAFGYGSIYGQGSGMSGKVMQDNRPVFLQKDFDGVANIFAPNIIIQNPPLSSDGFPDISDISFEM